MGGAFGIAALVVTLLIVVLVFVSAVPVALAIGQLVLSRSGSPFVQYLAGAAILALVLVACGFVPVLGAILFLAVWILGLGAFVVYLWRTRDEPARRRRSRLPPRPDRGDRVRPRAARGTRRTRRAGAPHISPTVA